jgi:hypothetical protein
MGWGAPDGGPASWQSIIREHVIKNRNSSRQAGLSPPRQRNRIREASGELFADVEGGGGAHLILKAQGSENKPNKYRKQETQSHGLAL